MISAIEPLRALAAKAFAEFFFSVARETIRDTGLRCLAKANSARR
jgi:hypothetical protein